MADKIVRRKIKDYIDHISESEAYLTAVLASCKLSDLVGVLIEMLQDPNSEDTNDAEGFIKDLFSYIPLEKRQAFEGQILSSGIVPLLMRNLKVPNHFTRLRTIDVVRRLNLSDKVDRFRDVFDHFNLRDPILMPTLLSEIWSLTHFDNPGYERDLLERLVSHESYLSRWAALGRLSDRWPNYFEEDKEGFLEKKRFIARLSEDPSELVRAEAGWLSRKLDFIQSMGPLEKLEKRKRSKEIDAQAPELTFDGASHRFQNDLHWKKHVDYELAELDQFVQYRVPFMKSGQFFLQNVLWLYAINDKEYGRPGTKKWLKDFLSTSNHMERFRKQFKTMMEDRSVSATEKISQYCQLKIQKTEDAHAFLSEIWEAATGKSWKPLRE